MEIGSDNALSISLSVMKNDGGLTIRQVTLSLSMKQQQSFRIKLKFL